MIDKIRAELKELESEFLEKIKDDEKAVESFRYLVNKGYITDLFMEKIADPIVEMIMAELKRRKEEELKDGLAKWVNILTPVVNAFGESLRKHSSSE